MDIETPRGRTGEESESVKDFFSILFAYPAAEPTGNALTGFQTLKLDLVDKIINTEKQSILIKISKLFHNEKSEDWWDQLPKEVRDSILEGVDDVEKGNVFAQEQVIREAKEKYGF